MDSTLFLTSGHLCQQLFQLWSRLQSALEIGFCVLWRENHHQSGSHITQDPCFLRESIEKCNHTCFTNRWTPSGWLLWMISSSMGANVELKPRI